MNYEAYIVSLSQIVKLKSVSTDPAFKPEIDKTVNWLKEYFSSAGFSVEIWQGPNSNPVVLASYTANPEAETVLVYGHYDVQPAKQEDGWDNDPFTLTQNQDRLYARGVVDNKGQFMIHAHTATTLAKENNLKYNVKFLIEGNEETSNEDLGVLIKENASKVAADYILVSDGEVSNDKPTVEFSLRGGFSFKINYKSANNNLHSGLYGGAAPSAAIELIKLVGNMFSNGKFAPEWFYANIDEVDAGVKANNEAVASNAAETLAHIGAKKFLLAEGEDLLTNTGLKPAVHVTGFKTGYIDEGFANIIPATAEVKINVRTVASQDNKQIIELIKKHVEDNTPDYIDYSIEFTNDYPPIKIDLNNPTVTKVQQLLEQAYEEKVVNKPVGGGIPVVGDFKELLGKDTLLVSLGNEDCNMHGVNENFKVDLVKKGLRFSELFFANK
ncbi:MAG: M20/M25/M40 family metallo-hydrolase [Patescibacteria group bacterium]|uniref:M20/M25/M40 family metallo-hydrolase n=1 Tax=candidate division WWE3 bacterium TaxID=2053526 RepID=A0A955J1J5_UNCKA|nr:M20/M25/M40 family metallo-hydrolase [candidate division WWE3 bacterium]